MGLVVHGCMVNADVYENIVGGCNLTATEHGRYGVSGMQKVWSAVLSLYGMFECELRCELLLLAPMVVLYAEDGVSSAECLKLCIC